ncbi:hypothetical protein JCM9279_001682 [Rhodotorula babjevae]
MALEDRVVAVAQPAAKPSNDDCQLLKLPDETLDYIFELAYHHLRRVDLPLDPCVPLEILEREPAHRPLCRRLYPIQQHQLYRDLEVTSTRNLELLARTLVEDRREPNCRLGTLVERLSLGSPGRRAWAGAAHIRRAQEWDLKRGRPHRPAPPVGAAAGLLAGLVGALGRVGSFHVFLDSCEDDSVDEIELLRTIFQDPATLDRWSSVKEFCLGTFGPTLDAAFPDDAGAWLDQLGRLPHLETLELSFSVQSMPAVFQASSPAPPVLEHVRKLKVYAPFHEWHVPLEGFVPNVTYLEVESSLSWSGPFGPRSLIGSAPPTLVDLAIISECGSISPDTIDDLFPTFPLLASLRLDISCFDLARLPSSLARLAHLKVLHFGEGDVLPDETLLRLVSGPHRITSLRTLKLDYIEAYFGPTLRDNYDVLPNDNERDASGVYDGWEPPSWPAGCSWAGLARAIGLARAHGVVVEGAAVRAVEWYGEYAAERDAIARLRGFQTGEWSDARQLLAHISM